MSNIVQIYEQASSQHRLGNIKEAESLYRQLLEQEPNHSDSLNLLGVICYQTGRYNEALNHLNRAVSINNTNPLFYFNLAKVYVGAALLQDALRCFSQAIALNPNYVEAYVGLGNTYRAERNLDQAEASYQKALTIKSDYAEAYGELARLYLAKSEWSKLESCAQTAIKLKPDYADVYRTLGNAHMAQSRTNEAIAAYERALQLNSRFAEAYWDMGIALNLRVMDYQHAALELKPDMADINMQMHLSNAFLGKGKLDQAIAGFKRVTRIAPKFADVHCDLGIALARQGNVEEAIASIQIALDLNPDFSKAHIALGNILEQQDKSSEAIAAFQRVLELEPNQAEANCAMGRLLLKQDKVDEAIACLQRALRVSPNLAEACYLIAGVYLAQREPMLAFEYAQKAVSLASQTPEVINTFGSALLALSQIDQAIEVYSRSLKLNPNLLMTNYCLGRAYQISGNFEESNRFFDLALAINPKYLDAIAGKAGNLEKKREFQAAYDLLRPVIEASDVDATIQNVFANVSRRLGNQREAIDLLEACLSKGSLRLDKQKSLLFALGGLYDEIGLFDEAFRSYHQGNTLEPNKFDAATFAEQFDQLIQIFSAANLAKFPRAENNSELPVFIVGMPRSGTTLLEQILSSYPQVFAAGELSDIGKIARNLSARLCVETPYPQSVELLTPNLISTLAEEQIYRLQQYSNSTNATQVIDKLPHNFLNLGLIALMFPKARVIHCMRNPLDTCLSCYFQDFMGMHPYKYNLEHLGLYYKQYQRLMAHWHNVLDIAILDVQYEDMVADQETMSRKIVDFLGLEWNEDCLNFHQSKRFARTASYDQVRKPIYTKSVERYRNYDKYLGSLKAALGVE
jgi:tetratricopeptide (TPR) repeat protein